MFGSEIQEYLEGKINHILKVADTLGNIEPSFDSIPCLIKIFPLFVKDGRVMVAVGTKDRPRGLSVTDCPFTAIINKDKVKFVVTDKLKRYIKHNHRDIPSELVNNIVSLQVDYKHLLEWLIRE